MYTHTHTVPLPPRSNKRSVYLTSLVFAVTQSLIYFLYSAGFVFGAFLVIQGRNDYGEIFRSVSVYNYFCCFFRLLLS